MISPKVLARGQFSPSNVLVTISDSNRKVDPVVESQIDALWQQKSSLAQAQGKHIYNGISYRLNTLEVTPAQLKIDLGKFDYKTRECLIEAEGYYQLDESYYRKGCHTLGTVKTSDDQYLLVEISSKSMNTNAIDFLGGIVEDNMKLENGDDLFQSFLVELEEEACVTIEDISVLYLALVYLSANTNIGFYFEVELKQTAAQVLARFEHMGKDQDVKALRAYSKSEYHALLSKHTINKQFVLNYVSI